jgi:tetratricopeptide (TPR) repeat protein
MRIMAGRVLIAAFLSVAAAGGADEAFRSGEAAFREGNTRAAETSYREALAIDPHHLGSLLQLALVVSWHDRLEESIVIYERALAVDPGNLRGRLGLARVESWTGDFDRAVSLYEGVLEEHPGHREATLGLARTLSWSDQSPRARAIYGGLLEADPSDSEVRNGLARTLSFEGHLDEALVLYQQSIEQDPGDVEALAGRARVYLWQGRSPQAWEAFNAAARVSPENREILELGDALDDSFASSLRLRAGVLVDSDDNVIDTQQALFTFTPALPVTLGVSYTRFDATQPCNRSDASPPCDAPASLGNSNELAARLETIAVRAGWRWKPDLVLSGSAGIDRIDRERAGESTIGTASAGADWRMNDRWSFSGALARETYAATALTLDRGIGQASLTGTAAWVPAPRLGARFTLQRAGLSDGNGRNLAAGFLRWSVPLARPRVALTGFARYMTHDDAGSIGQPGPGSENGYFSPDLFWANIAGCEVSDRIGSRFGWSVQGTLGLQYARVRDDSELSSDTVRGYNLRASYDLGPRVSIEGWFGRTNLALQGPTGYTSTESGVALRWRTGWPKPGVPGAFEGPGTGELNR